MSIKCTLGGHDLLRQDAMMYRCVVCSHSVVGETEAVKAGMPSTVAVSCVAILAGLLASAIGAMWGWLIFGPLWTMVHG